MEKLGGFANVYTSYSFWTDLVRLEISDASCVFFVFFSEIDPKLMFLEYLAFKAIFKSKAELEIHLGKLKGVWSL